MEGTIAQRAHYDQNGYLFLPCFFDPSFISALTHVCDEIFQQWLTKHYQTYIEDQLINMHSLSDPVYFSESAGNRALLFNLVAHENLVHLCNQLFGDHLYFHNTQLFFNPADTRKPTYWHRDLQYAGIDESEQIALLPQLLNLHARIALIPERGLELIPQTHRRWDTPLERAVRLEQDGHTSSDALPGALRLDLEPGDLLIFNAHMLHRGNYVLNETRKAFDVLIGEPHPLMTKWLDDRLLPTREEMAKIDSPGWYHNARNIIGQEKAD